MAFPKNSLFPLVGENDGKLRSPKAPTPVFGTIFLILNS